MAHAQGGAPRRPSEHLRQEAGGGRVACSRAARRSTCKRPARCSGPPAASRTDCPPGLQWLAMAEFEHHQLSLPRGTTREHARTVLSVAAAYGGWELARYRVWPDGRRQVEVRRRVDPTRPLDAPPLPSFPV